MGFAAIASHLQIENLTVAGFVTVTALVFLLAFLNVIEAIDVEKSIRRTLIAVIIPLLIVFIGITIYHSLVVLRWV